MMQHLVYVIALLLLFAVAVVAAELEVLNFVPEGSFGPTLIACVAALVAVPSFIMMRTPSQSTRQRSIPMKALTSRSDADVVIVGCGVAGATLAIALGDAGRKVTVIEKSLEQQDRIVGELLQPGGIRVLERLGIDECAKTGCDSIRVDGYVVIQPGSESSGPTTLPLTYPIADPANLKQFMGMRSPDEHSNNSPKGRSFHNSRFVHNLQQRAIAHPNVNVILGVAKDVIRMSELDEAVEANVDKIVCGLRYKPDGADPTAPLQQVTAPLTVLADGIWSSMRKHVTDAQTMKASSFVGLVLQHPAMESPVPYRHHGHVILADPNPVLLYQISPTETRVLVDVPGALPSTQDGSMQAYMHDKIEPQLPESVRTSFAEAVDRGEFKSMPNRALNAEPSKLRGAIALGDAWNMRHPLTGGGMTVALCDSEALSHALRDVNLRDAGAVDRAIEGFRHKRQAHAATINVLANALHRVFTAPAQDDGTRKMLREACFNYLAMGGMYAAGPIGLLAGLTPKPGVLSTHFFMVALYAVRMALFPFPTPGRLMRAYSLLHVACMIIMPMLEAEGTTVLASPPVKMLVNLVFPWRNVPVGALG